MAFCPPLPEGHSRIFALSDEEAYKDGAIFGSTACWRGYQGAWEIRDGRFYLVNLRGRYNLHAGEPILADWFSGVLRIPQGKRLQYVHMGFGSVYEQEVHIKIEKGIVTATRIVDNRGKDHNAGELGLRNLPGGENHFPGDDE